MKKNLILLFIGFIINYLLTNPPIFILDLLAIYSIDFAGTSIESSFGDSFLLHGLILGLELILLRYFLKLMHKLFRQTFNKSS